MRSGLQYMSSLWPKELFSFRRSDPASSRSSSHALTQVKYGPAFIQQPKALEVTCRRRHNSSVLFAGVVAPVGTDEQLAWIARCYRDDFNNSMDPPEAGPFAWDDVTEVKGIE